MNNSIKRFRLVAIGVVLLAGCGITKQTIKDVVVAQAQFPLLAQLVAECVAGTPTEALIAEDYNILVDKHERSKQLRPNAALVKALVNARAEVTEAGNSWVSVKVALIESGLECDPRVETIGATTESGFDGLEDAMDSNEDAVKVFQYLELIGDAVIGPKIELVKLAVKAAQ